MTMRPVLSSVTLVALILTFLFVGCSKEEPPPPTAEAQPRPAAPPPPPPASPSPTAWAVNQPASVPGVPEPGCFFRL